MLDIGDSRPYKGSVKKGAMMRHRWLLMILILSLPLVFVAVSCEEDEEDDSPYRPNCYPGLDFFFNECGFYVTFDDVEEVSFDEAWESCQGPYGRMWRDFIHCWRHTDTCEELADCLPDHGFYTDDDDDDDNDDDNNDDDNDDNDDDETPPAR